MKRTFGIKQKITLGFALLIAIFIINAIISIAILTRNQKLVSQISTVIDPSLDALNELNLMINRSKMLSTNWVFIVKNKEEKDSLKKLIEVDYPELVTRLNNHSNKWADSSHKKLLNEILKDFEKLIKSEKEITSTLVKFEDYNDATLTFMAQDIVESAVIPQTAALEKKISNLLEIKNKEKKEYEILLVDSSNNLRNSVASLGLIIAIIGIFISTIIANAIVKPVNRIKEVMNQLGRGEIPKVEFEKRTDEIGEMQNSIATVIKGIQQTSEFAEKIGRKELDAEYTPLSESDVLGHSLLNMRNNLKIAEIKDKQTNWILDGSANIDNIIRNHTRLDELADLSIQYIVKRIDAVQGAFYVVTHRDEKDYRNTILELISTFAYNRKKLLNKKIRMAEGLVGQAAIEQDTVLRTEIPYEYVTITSGILGDKRPTCILIVPLISDGKTYGAIELAGFERFEEYKIKFVETIAPNIARAIANIQVNEHTKMLLQESQRMSHELQQQQEELRQNAEEMMVTQEELERTNARLQEQIYQVELAGKRMQQLLYNASEVITIYEPDGTVRYISPSVINILGYPAEELIAMKGRTYVYEDDLHKSRAMFKKLLEDPEHSQTIQYRFLRKDGTWIWLEATGKNLLNDPAIKGIVINARDITVRIKAEQEERMRKNMQSLSENSPDIITRISVQGKITYTNPMIYKYSGYPAEKFVNKFLSEIDYAQDIVTSWSNMLDSVKRTNDKTTAEVEYETTEGKKIMQVNAIPEFNDDTLESVLIVSHDITERKQSELEIQEKNKKISESINYSKRIQTAVIPDNKIISEIFPNSYIFYQPRDVVSGDFPWIMRKNDNVYVAAVDCTGHGVPGAMLSLVGSFLLNEIIRYGDEKDPANILDTLDRMVNSSLNTDKNESSIKDGMDIALCKINIKNKKLLYAGAHRPLLYVRNGELSEYKGDRWAIGGGIYKNQTQFTNHEINIIPGDCVHIFSDGLVDQFGGPNVRKFGIQKVKEIVTTHWKDIHVCGEKIKEEFNAWKGTQKQTDDVIMIGIKF
ncbi:MAG: PAS domain S-box protein [Cytophagaceae bacterium]|nr:PAS domain S-box protein [Cytophagaceae bacterium]MDW8456197.1 PAS domain S-box protein [Cytophagaceae bacterium]